MGRLAGLGDARDSAPSPGWIDWQPCLQPSNAVFINVHGSLKQLADEGSGIGVPDRCQSTPSGSRSRAFHSLTVHPAVNTAVCKGTSSFAASATVFSSRCCCRGILVQDSSNDSDDRLSAVADAASSLDLTTQRARRGAAGEDVAIVERHQVLQQQQCGDGGAVKGAAIGA